MPRTPVPNETAGATDSTDAEVIKGPGNPTQAGATIAPTSPTNLTTSASLETGQAPAVVGATGQAPTGQAPAVVGATGQAPTGQAPAVVGATQAGALGSVRPAPSSSTQELGSSTTGSSVKAQAPVSTIVHSITSTNVGTITADADTAMNGLRGDISNLHKLLSNATHYATLPVAEVEKLIARASALLGVIRSKL
jgi:hypothetical protein